MFEYGKIIRRSIEIVKKNKWLLIYGALTAVSFSSSGSGGGGKNKENIKLDDLPKNTTQVLGEFINYIKDWFSSISPATWTLMVIGFILATIIGIVAMLVIKNWARGSLIFGVQMALNDKPVNLSNTSLQGKAKTKDLIILSVIIISAFLASIIVFAIIAGVLYFLIKSQITLFIIVAVLMMIPLVIVFALGLILLSMSTNYSERLVVLNNLKPWVAFKNGVLFGKKYFGGTAIMGLISGVLTGIFGFISVIITLIILGIPSFVMIYPSVINNKIPSPIVWVFMAIFILIFVTTVSLITSVSEVFKFSNWNQMFNKIKSLEETKNEK